MSVESLIDPGSSLGELVAERPVRAHLFEQLRLDYCCGGHQTLAAACTKRGLELDEGPRRPASARRAWPAERRRREPGLA